MSIKNLEERVAKLEESRSDKIVVIRVVYEVIGTSEETEDGEWSGNAKKLESFSPEEEAVLQQYQEELVAAAKPGEYVAVFWTRHKLQELMALAHDPASTGEPPG
ncbi:MAG: hypothetical protein WC600_03310 [Desulfobaccales bacterium]